MPKKLETIEVRFPKELVEQMTLIAKLAGVSVETVIKVYLATTLKPTGEKEC